MPSANRTVRVTVPASRSTISKAARATPKTSGTTPGTKSKTSHHHGCTTNQCHTTRCSGFNGARIEDEPPNVGAIAGTVTPRENQSTAATASAGRTNKPSQRQRRALIQDQPRTWPWPSVSGATKQRSPGQTREASRRPSRSAWDQATKGVHALPIFFHPTRESSQRSGHPTMKSVTATALIATATSMTPAQAKRCTASTKRASGPVAPSVGKRR